MAASSRYQVTTEPAGRMERSLRSIVGLGIGFFMYDAWAPGGTRVLVTDLETGQVVLKKREQFGDDSRTVERTLTEDLATLTPHEFAERWLA